MECHARTITRNTIFATFSKTSITTTPDKAAHLEDPRSYREGRAVSPAPGRSGPAGSDRAAADPLRNGPAGPARVQSAGPHQRGLHRHPVVGTGNVRLERHQEVRVSLAVERGIDQDVQDLLRISHRSGRRDVGHHRQQALRDGRLRLEEPEIPPGTLELRSEPQHREEPRGRADGQDTMRPGDRAPQTGRFTARDRLTDDLSRSPFHGTCPPDPDGTLKSDRRGAVPRDHCVRFGWRSLGRLRDGASTRRGDPGVHQGIRCSFDPATERGRTDLPRPGQTH